MKEKKKVVEMPVINMLTAYSLGYQKILQLKQ